LLFGIAVSWIACAIMTVAGYLPDDHTAPSYRARTDVRSDVIRLTPWVYVPYPGQQLARLSVRHSVYTLDIIIVVTSKCIFYVWNIKQTVS